MQYEFKHYLNKNDLRREGILASTIARLNVLPLDHSWMVEVTLLKRERTAKQRRSLFGVAYKALMEFSGLSGAAEKDALHWQMCGEYWGWKRTALGTKVPNRTTTTNENGERDVISTMEQLDFYAFLQRLGAGVGCNVPDPDPFWREKAELEMQQQVEREDE